jgi:hypothetical protein
VKVKKALLSIAALIMIAILSPASHLSAAPLSTLSLTLNFPLMMNNHIGPPPSSTSYYIKGDATNNFNLGCSKGTEDKNAKETRDSAVILDYGGIKIQNGVYGATFNLVGGFISVDEIATATEDFALGYNYCIHQGSNPDYYSHITIIIGTNTSTDQINITADHAAAWANMVYNINVYFKNINILSQVTAAGGNDIELDPLWQPPSIVNPWIDSFVLHSVSPDPDITVKHYNFGNAVDCTNDCLKPWWTKHDVWYVSWGAQSSGRIFPFPEIYKIDQYNINYNNAQQWYAVGQYSHYHESSQMTFPAVLTQFQACQQRSCPNDVKTNPDRGWLELMRRLAADVDTRQLNIQWLSDLIWYPQ